MRCPTCGVENAQGVRFCAGCGVPLEPGAQGNQSVAYCTTCGAQNPADAWVCGECGFALGHTDDISPGPPTSPAQRGTGSGAFVSKDLGELLEETIRIYNQEFQAFFLIALIAQIPSLIGGLVQVTALSVVLTIVGFMFHILAVGGVIVSVGWVYLGGRVSVSGSYRGSAGRFWSLLGSAILFLIPLVVWGLLWGFFGVMVPALGGAIFLFGIPVVVYLLVIRMFYAQGIMLEGKGPLKTLKRSGELVQGTWWRVLGVVVLFFALGVAAPTALSIIVSFYNVTVAGILSTVLLSLGTPFSHIGATLVYIDIRARKEGYSLERMAAETGF